LLRHPCEIIATNYLETNRNGIEERTETETAACERLERTMQVYALGVETL
jgi:hypothetical protein